MIDRKSIVFRKISVIGVLVILFIFPGCASDWSVEIWEQKIEGTNLSIYDFSAWGGRDTRLSGLKIKKSSMELSLKDFRNPDDFDKLKTIPHKDKIKVIKTVKPINCEPNLNTPLSIEHFEINGIAIEQETYRFHGAASGYCSLKKYEFKTFEETRDSLIFYNNTSQFVGGKSYDRIAIPKGNVYLMTSKDNQYVTRVTYNDLLIFDDLTDRDDNGICSLTIYFNPIERLKLTAFSDYGIFKPVK